jgi:hypothetical protein
MAEDELTQYSTDARKIEKLRQKIGLSVSAAEQKQIKEQLQAELPDGGLAKLLHYRSGELRDWVCCWAFPLCSRLIFLPPLSARPLPSKYKSGAGS